MRHAIPARRRRAAGSSFRTLVPWPSRLKLKQVVHAPFSVVCEREQHSTIRPTPLPDLLSATLKRCPTRLKRILTASRYRVRGAMRLDSAVFLKLQCCDRSERDEKAGAELETVAREVRI